MRIIYFHQHFTTPDGSSGTRSYEISRRLVERGHEVLMICGDGALCKSGLSGRYINGQREGTVDGIHVIELELPYSNYDNILRRSRIFLRFALRSVLLALTRQYDVIFCTSTPLTAALPGIAARWLRRKPFVFEVRDLWPELPRAMGVLRNPIALRLLDWLEFAAYHSAQICVGLSPGIAEGIVRRGIQPNRVVIAPNGCDLDLFSPDMAQPTPEVSGVPTDAFVATFTGAHGAANGLDKVLDAAGELLRRGRDDIFLVFIGDGKQKPRLLSRVKGEKLSNCIFVDPMPKKVLAQFLCRRANVGLMILDNVPAFYYGTSPNKFFDYLSSGLPILVNYPGWMAEIVTTCGIGVSVPPHDPISFADALVHMAEFPEHRKAMGLRARRLAEGEFERSALVQRCITAIEGAAANSGGNRQAYVRWGKRLLDLTVLLILSPLVLPITLIVTALVRLCNGSPVLFRQQRPGYRSQPFTLLKFRTMNSICDESGRPLPDERRLTQCGKILRRYSLDELPQLWNVLRGEMTLVGPRPLLMKYLERYTPAQARRQEVTPGVTGWAQINGRNALTWEEKFLLDQWYVDNISLSVDLKVLLKTSWCALASRGISQPGHVTAEEFKGYQWPSRAARNE